MQNKILFYMDTVIKSSHICMLIKIDKFIHQMMVLKNILTYASFVICKNIYLSHLTQGQLWLSEC